MTSLISVVLFLIPILWVSTLFALSVTGNAPSTSLGSLLTKPSPEEQEAELEKVPESSQRTRDKLIRLWPLAVASGIAGTILLIAGH